MYFDMPEMLQPYATNRNRKISETTPKDTEYETSCRDNLHLQNLSEKAIPDGANCPIIADL